MLEIKTLGDFSLRVNGQAIVDLGSRKAEALLVYLAVEEKQQNRGVLATLFWPESNKEHASTSLRVELSVLRNNLGNYLEISRQAVRIKPNADIYLDVTELEGKLASGQIDAALGIYQGDFLQGFHIHGSASFEDWLRWEQERLRISVVSALHEAISGAIDARDYLKGHTYVQRLLELDPLDERAYQGSMLLLALEGKRSVALAQFEQCREVLKAELEVEPSIETRDLYEKIVHEKTLISLDQAITKHNLPAPQTSFIGRELELIQIGDLIKDPACRLLTLVGPGGIGKTRLALKAASNNLRYFPDGTYFVPVESSYSTDYLVPAMTSALDFEIETFVAQMGPKTQLFDYLKNRSILLLMDGFEQIINGAELLSELLERAPRVKVLVTSRQRLGLKGEWTFLVRGLPVPRVLEGTSIKDSDAMKLFTQRAQQVKEDLRFTKEDGDHVVRICKLVEGMPLGIELAATWATILSPIEIAIEMEKSLDFLATEIRDIPEKHRSLRAVFESSWSTLLEDQKDTLSKLSVFRDKFDRRAADEVANANLHQLSTFLDKCLLRRESTGYFTMHALLRQFIAEKLNQKPQMQIEVLKRHCEHYVGLLTEREADFLGSGMLKARDEIRPELENVRAAIEWAIKHWETEPIRKLLVTSLSFFIVHGWYEGILAFKDITRQREEHLRLSGISNLSKDPIILSARIHQAFLLSNLGQIDESEAISQECLGGLAEQGMKAELSECLHNLGVNASFRGEYEDAKEYLEEAILKGRECDHTVWPTYLLWYGHNYFLLGEYEQGMLSLRKCYDLFDHRGTLWGVAFALGKMGLAADGLGEHSQAMHYHREALAIFERLGNRAGKGYSLSRMSISAYFLEDYLQAVKYGQEGYQFFEEIGHRWGICTSLSRLGFAYIGLGNTEKAKEFFKDALRLSKQNQMLPQSLYALLGMACTLAQEGDERTALKLYRYVQRHPQAPAPYLQQSARWFTEIGREFLPGEDAVVSINGETGDIDTVIDRLFNELSVG